MGGYTVECERLRAMADGYVEFKGQYHDCVREHITILHMGNNEYDVIFTCNWEGDDFSILPYRHPREAQGIASLLLLMHETWERGEIVGKMGSVFFGRE